MPTSSPDIAQKNLVFSGEFRPLLDGKKRLTIPARWRSEALEEVFIIKSLDRGCLAAMPQAVLQEMGEKAASLAPTVEAHQTFKDHFFASAVNCPIDSQGRMVAGGRVLPVRGDRKGGGTVLAGERRKIRHLEPRWLEAMPGGRHADLPQHPQEPRAMTFLNPNFPHDLC